MNFKVDKDKRAALIYDKAEYEEESDIVLLMYLLDNTVDLNNIELENNGDIVSFRKNNKGKLVQFAGDVGANKGIKIGDRIEVVADKIAELKGKRPDIQKLKTSEIEKLDTNEALAKIDEILGTNYVQLYSKVTQNSMEQKLEQEDGIKDERKCVYLEEDERRKEL